LLLVPVLAISADGGPGAMLATIGADNPHLLNPWQDETGQALGWMAIASLGGWGLGYFGQPHILARFAGIHSGAEVPLARRIAVTWTAFGLVGAVLVGLAGVAYLTNHGAGPLTDPETVFMVLVDAMFHPVIAGVLLAAILAAIMSTADSQLLVASSALAEDLYRPLLKSALGRDAGRREVMWIGRAAVLLLAVTATLLAADPGRSVLGLVAYAWAGFGAAFGPVLVASLYWPRMNWFGAVAGVLTGGLVVVIWKQLDGGLFDLYEIIPGVTAATLAIIVASLGTAPPGAEIRAGFGRFLTALRAGQ
jgi:sodium/proline symporter